MRIAMLAALVLSLATLKGISAEATTPPSGKYVLFGTGDGFRLEPIAVEISGSGDSMFIAAIGNPSAKVPVEIVDGSMFFTFREPAFSGETAKDSDTRIFSFAVKLDKTTELFKGVLSCFRFGQYVPGAANVITGGFTLFPIPTESQ